MARGKAGEPSHELCRFRWTHKVPNKMDTLKKAKNFPTDTGSKTSPSAIEVNAAVLL